MTSRRCQTGAAGVLVVAVLVLMMVVILAGYLLTRVDSNRGDRTETMERLAKAAEALDAYAAAAFRLPCPADPALDTGEEVPGASVGTCSFSEGTLPWKSIGMSRDGSFDSWARKISYRVYTGNQGSLTQPGGASMVQCDADDPAPAARSGTSGSAGGLCIESTDVYQRATSPANFLQNKQLPLTDSGITPPNVANVGYVLVSHGPTGLGGYTASGTRLDLPTSSDERNNTKAAGAFTIRPFSGPEIPATDNQHFDDLLLYRRIPEIVSRAGLAARDWPEGALFNAATMQSAIGSSAYGATAVSSFNFAGNTYRAMGAPGSRISFSSSGGVEGIGVEPVSGDTYFLTTAEYIQIDLGIPAARIGVALNHFGTFSLSAKYREQAQFRFFSDGSLVGSSVVRQGCRGGSGLATFMVEPTIPGATFNRMEIQPLDISPSLFGIDSRFLLSEFAACSAALATCTPTLATPENTCTAPTISGIAIEPDTIGVGSAAAVIVEMSNGTDHPAHGGIAFTMSFPTNVVLSGSPDVRTTCPAGGGDASFVPVPPSSFSAPAGGSAFSVNLLNIAEGVASCRVRVSITGVAPGNVILGAPNISGAANIRPDANVSDSLQVQ